MSATLLHAGAIAASAVLSSLLHIGFCFAQTQNPSTTRSRWFRFIHAIGLLVLMAIPPVTAYLIASVSARAAIGIWLATNVLFLAQLWINNGNEGESLTGSLVFLTLALTSACIVAQLSG